MTVTLDAFELDAGDREIAGKILPDLFEATYGPDQAAKVIGCLALYACDALMTGPVTPETADEAHRKIACARMMSMIITICAESSYAESSSVATAVRDFIEQAVRKASH